MCRITCTACGEGSVGHEPGLWSRPAIAYSAAMIPQTRSVRILDLLGAADPVRPRFSGEPHLAAPALAWCSTHRRRRPPEFGDRYPGSFRRSTSCEAEPLQNRPPPAAISGCAHELPTGRDPH